MQRPTRWMRGAIAHAALALAGAVAAWAASPLGPAWTADPEEQYLLDVNIRQLRLGDGVRAYQTPEGTCVVFGDFLTTLDLPMKIDLETKKASGWAFREEHRIEIDQASGTARFGALARDQYRGGEANESEGAHSQRARGSQGCTKHLLPRPNFCLDHRLLRRNCAHQPGMFRCSECRSGHYARPGRPIRSLF